MERGKFRRRIGTRIFRGERDFILYYIANK